MPFLSVVISCRSFPLSFLVSLKWLIGISLKWINKHKCLNIFPIAAFTHEFKLNVFPSCLLGILLIVVIVIVYYYDYVNLVGSCGCCGCLCTLFLDAFVRVSAKHHVVGWNLLCLCFYTLQVESCPRRVCASRGKAYNPFETISLSHSYCQSTPK